MLNSSRLASVLLIFALMMTLIFTSCTSIKTGFVVKQYTEQEIVYKHSSDNPQTDEMTAEKISVEKYRLEMQQEKYLDVPKTLGLAGLIGAGAVALAYTVAQIWVISWLPW